MRHALLSATLLTLLGCNTKGSVTFGDTAGVDSGGLIDVDRDGYEASVDCDDGDAAVHPGATEVCDGVDNNCDGQVDEGLATTWYTDADGDGYGDDASAVTACTQPSGTVAAGGDCNDADTAYHPGASETVCTDTNDYNCDGSTGNIDADGDGYVACDECDDGDAAVHPGATEVCDGVDNNCDGSTDGADAADASTWYADADGDGYGDPSSATTACTAPAGTVADSSDCDDTSAAVSPAATEICDGVDNNCDGSTDGADAVDASTWYADADGDGYGDAASTAAACTAPDGYLADNTDCNDASATSYPGASERCDGLDNDCDGEIDEIGAVDGTTYYSDADGDGYGDLATAVLACSQPSGTVKNHKDCDDTDAAVNIDAVEVCDNVDNDCDGSIDWGLRVPDDYSAIQSAIDASSDGDTVCVSAGTYLEQINFGGKDITVEGTSGSALTTIDGDGDGPVVDFSDHETSAAVLDGFTITGGSATKGAGVYLKKADPTLLDLVITGNTCDSSTSCLGAGIYADTADFTLTGSSVTANQFTDAASSTGVTGAGVYLTNSDVVFQDVDVTDNTISAGSSGYYSTGYGAGIYATTTVSLEFDGGSIAGNTIDLSAAGYGYGGGAGLYAYSNADVTLDNVRVTDNAVSGAYSAAGGGAYIYYNATLSMRNAIVANNSATAASTSYGSYGAYGGGIYLYDGDLALENVDVVGNSVTGSQAYGGGLYVYYYASLDAVNTNFASNTYTASVGGSGGAIGMYSYSSATDFSVTYSNIYGNTSPEVHGRPTPVGSDGDISVDPVYTDVSATDGLDWDLKLGSGSACIDAGDPSILDTDGTTSDIGAYGGTHGSLD